MRARLAVPALLVVPALIGILAGCDPDRPTSPASSFEETPAPRPPAGEDSGACCPRKFSTKAVKTTFYDTGRPGSRR